MTWKTPNNYRASISLSARSVSRDGAVASPVSPCSSYLPLSQPLSWCANWGALCSLPQRCVWCYTMLLLKDVLQSVVPLLCGDEHNPLLHTHSLHGVKWKEATYGFLKRNNWQRHCDHHEHLWSTDSAQCTVFEKQPLLFSPVRLSESCRALITVWANRGTLHCGCWLKTLLQPVRFS